MNHLWGQSRLILEHDDLLIVLANAVGGDAASSLHVHGNHDNSIVVASGQCAVSYPDSAGVMHKEQICRGETLKIPAGTPHRLRFFRPAKIIEMYTLTEGWNGRATLADIQRIEDGWAPREKPMKAATVAITASSIDAGSGTTATLDGIPVLG